MSRYDFTSYVNDYTRIFQNTKSCIYHSFIKNFNTCISKSYIIIICDIIDHYAKMVIINIRDNRSKMSINSLSLPEFKYKTDYNHFNMLIQIENLNTIINLIDVDKSYNSFNIKTFKLINLSTRR